MRCASKDRSSTIVPWYKNSSTFVSQNGTEQWSRHWNVHNFSRSTLISLRIFVVQRTLWAPHVRGFNYYNTHVVVLTFLRHGPSDLYYSTTVLFTCGSGHRDSTEIRLRRPIFFEKVAIQKLDFADHFFLKNNGVTLDFLNVPLQTRYCTMYCLLKVPRSPYTSLRKLRLGVWA